jgi:hypothetical protein
MAKTWHKFIAGLTYDRDEVIATCDPRHQGELVEVRISELSLASNVTTKGRTNDR